LLELHAQALPVPGNQKEKSGAGLQAVDKEKEKKVSARDPIVKTGDGGQIRDPIVINGGPGPIAGNGERRPESPQLTSLEEYPGGKGGAGVWQTIINQQPPHGIYIEAFLGSGRVLRMKKPAACSIALDSDAYVCQSWKPELYPDLTVINGDALAFLGSYKWTGSELVYCDPPYLRSERSCQRDYYRHEFAEESQHRTLLEVLIKAPALIQVSGYDSPLYQEMLSSWRLIKIPTINRAGKRVIDCLWCNYPEPFALHDFRYLGANFRQRERIKRKKNRWQKRLASMPLLERAAILAAIEELRTRYTPLAVTLAPGM
jgi:DNA adenine methylase